MSHHHDSSESATCHTITHVDLVQGPYESSESVRVKRRHVSYHVNKEAWRRKVLGMICLMVTPLERVNLNFL